MLRMQSALLQMLAAGPGRPASSPVDAAASRAAGAGLQADSSLEQGAVEASGHPTRSALRQEAAPARTCTSADMPSRAVAQSSDTNGSQEAEAAPHPQIPDGLPGDDNMLVTDGAVPRDASFWEWARDGEVTTAADAVSDPVASFWEWAKA